MVLSRSRDTTLARKVEVAFTFFKSPPHQFFFIIIIIIIIIGVVNVTLR
jgi:hypothetical protein